MRVIAAAVALLLGAGARVGLAQTGCVAPSEACAFFNQYLHALNARDWEAFRATFDDGISAMFEQPAPPQRFDGRAAVEAMFQRIFPAPGAPLRQPPPPIVPENLRVQDYGDVVVVSFEFSNAQQVARRTVVLHRGANGWRVVHIHGSSRPAQGH